MRSSLQTFKELWCFNLETHSERVRRCLTNAFFNYYFENFIDTDELQALLDLGGTVMEEDIDFRAPSVFRGEVELPQAGQPEPTVDSDLVKKYIIQIFFPNEECMYLGGRRPDAFTILKDVYLSKKLIFLETFKKSVLTYRHASSPQAESDGNEVQRETSAITVNCTEDNVFRSEGDIWKIVYQGEKLPPLKDCKGFKYIARLLEGETFEKPLALYYAVNGPPNAPVQKDAQALSHAEDLHELSSGRDPLQEEDILSERKADKHLKRKLQQLSADRDRAKEINDEASLHRINDEFEQIQRELGGHTISRRRRKWDSSNTKAHNAVSKAIKRAIEAIQVYHLDLARHLRSNLTPIRFPYSYQPSPDTRWKTHLSDDS